MSGVGGTGDIARRMFGIGEPGTWGVVGHGGVSSWSSPPKATAVEVPRNAVELRGSNIVKRRLCMVQRQTKKSSLREYVIT